MDTRPDEDERETSRLEPGRVGEDEKATARYDSPPPPPAPTAAPWRRAPELEPGEAVQRWVVDRLLGRGGMGAVYAGRDPTSGQEVAIKVLLATGDPRAVERFRREGVAQAAADQHPNVVRVLGSGEHRGAPFLVMDLATGGDLASRLKAGPLPAAEAAGVVAQLARGLAHVHARGVLHRDLKPANVLFDAQGAPRLVDFGVARLRGEDALTKTGEMLGTPAYMAPEQADGARSAIDERTDVYGLGAILYHAVAGAPPFGGEALPEVLRKVLMEAPAPPSSRVEGLSPDVDRVVLKALAKEPADRYASARELAADLERLARGESVVGEDLEGARRRARRTRVALAGALGAALVVGGGLSLWRTWPRLSAMLAGAPAEAPFVPPTGELRSVHGKTHTRLRELLVSGQVQGDAIGARVSVNGRPELAGTAAVVSGRVELDLGANTLRLEAQRRDDGRWVPVGDPLQVLRDEHHDPPPPDEVTDLRGRVLKLDEAREEYVAHDGSVLLYVPVPRGTFEMGSTECKGHADVGIAGHTDETTEVSSPVHRVRLTRPFLIGKHEVSQRQLERWLAEARLEGERPVRQPGWQDDFPATDVSYYEARAYAAWAGLELPTETQWEWAARGPKGPRYVWGDGDPEPMVHARFRADPRRRPPGPTAVDDASLRDVSWVGALHMAGNVREWTRDQFLPSYGLRIEYSQFVDPLAGDDARLPPGALRVTRGGAWDARRPMELLAAWRDDARGDLGESDGGRDHDHDDLGLRVVLTLRE